MDYGKAIEPLISKMVAISYKTLTNIPLSESDKRHREYIIECTRMYDNMVKNDKVMHDNKIEEKISKDEDKKEVYNWFDDEPIGLTENWFNDDDDDDVTDIFKENKAIVPHEKKEDVKKEDEITFGTNEKLMEIAKNNRIKFDELTKKCNEELKHVNDSFWTVIEIK